MSNIKKLTEFENAMETICDECKTRYPIPMEENYCLCNCMVRQIWRNILDESKKEREKQTMEITNVIELIKKLEKLPPNTPIYVGGTQGYLHITTDEDGNKAVCFDDSEEI